MPEEINAFVLNPNRQPTYGRRDVTCRPVIVENGAAMLSKTFVEMALGLPNVMFAAFLVELALAERDSKNAGVSFFCVCVGAK